MARASRFATLTLLLLAACARPDIAADETVVVLPTAARLDPTGDSWTIPLHAWVFEREADSVWRGITVAGLADLLGLPAGSDENRNFQERARDFLVEDKGGKTVELSLDGRRSVRLPATGPDGHAETEAQVPSTDLPPATGNPWLTAAVVLEPGDQRVFAGGVQLIGPEGPSVISDIDDTIKISDVTDRKQLLERTFLRPFEAVPGMAETYRSWQEAGAVFHYVSSSPWQLYPALAAFMADAAFPRGSFHLRHFSIKDEAGFNLFASSKTTKPPVIEALLEAYPGRDFILVGDSGESDPGIYGEIARAHPGRIRHVYIRLVTPDHRDSPRMQKDFADFPDDLWTLFEDPSGLPTSIGVE